MERKRNRQKTNHDPKHGTRMTIHGRTIKRLTRDLKLGSSSRVFYVLDKTAPSVIVSYDSYA
jgi:hypothetical protein